ncbi:hypothetical protein OEZ83_26360, partial [Leclercia adecarboxylata]
AQQLAIGGGGAGFCLRLEETAEGDITRTLAGGLLSERQLRMAGGAYDRLAPEQGSCSGQGAILLAEVQANAQSRRQLGIVIDDQLRAILRAELSQCIGLAQSAGLVAGFVAILQQARATFQCCFDVRQQAAFG